TSFVTIATLAPGLATYSDTTVSFNAGYSYRLVAVGTYGSSTSVPASVTVQPGAPTSLTAVSPMSTLANLAVNLSWTGHPAGQDNFLVYRATGSGTATLIATLGPAVTSYSDVTVAEGGTYTYTVIARNAAGNSLPSNAATVTAASRPAAPGGLTAQPATRTRISLAWVNNANNQASFRIERAVGSGPFTALTTLASTVSAGTLLAYTDTPVLNNGTIYSYRVFAVNLMGDSPASGVAQAATATTAPPAPTVVTASGRQVTATATSVTVTWTEPATGLTNLPTSYDIQRRTGSAGAATWTTLATVPSTGGLTYTDTTATFGSAYGYRIRASNAAGNSAYFPGTTAGQQVVWTPGAPASLSATVSNGIVTLSWPAVTSSHTGYRVERSAAGGAFAALATVTSTVTTGNISATDTTAAAGIGYTYRVFAVNAVGDSLASPTATATVPTLPGAPTGLTATQRTNPLGVVLTWVNNATNATAFEVQRATGAAGTFTTLATVAGANITTYTDGTAAINVAGGYRYQVRAINAGGSSAFSPVVSITPAIAHVQSVVSTAVASASAVTTPALGAAQAAGNLNIVVVSWKDTTRSVTNVVDSRGVTYAQAGTTTSGTGLRQAVYYAVAQAGSSTTVTARFNGAATSPEVRFLEYSGVSALDQFAGASGTNANANSGNTAATTAANELVFGACFSSNATTVGTGFTARVTTSTGLAEEKTVTATGAQSATASVAAGTGRAWVIQAVTFK
ncbi:MAG TPA: hypothetical protein DCM86_17180, partial [Verrucomicrobiales bacterium]|nr:hypothetical protein [Verrucomicrobiales bacterium]